MIRLNICFFQLRVYVYHELKKGEGDESSAQYMTSHRPSGQGEAEFTGVLSFSRGGVTLSTNVTAIMQDSGAPR